jgi:hypothetical protein
MKLLEPYFRDLGGDEKKDGVDEDVNQTIQYYDGDASKAEREHFNMIDIAWGGVSATCSSTRRSWVREYISIWTTLTQCSQSQSAAAARPLPLPSSSTCAQVAGQCALKT